MVNHKIGIIIQARMGSSRLPKKILLNLPHHKKIPIIEHIIKRAKACKKADNIIVATSEKTENDILETILENKSEVFRGSENNVLSRFYLIAQKYQFNTIVRLTGDNPCIDPMYIEQAIDFHLKNDADYTCTRGLPLGMNIEVLSFIALKNAFKNARKHEELEHVTPYITSRSEQSKLYYLKVSQDNFNWRLTVDTPSDYAIMCLLYQNLHPENSLFGYKEIKEFLQNNPWGVLINQNNFQKKGYHSFEEEKEDVIFILKKYGFHNTINYLYND